MSVKGSSIPIANLDRLIYEIRGQKVMLDADLAAAYGVETRALVQADLPALPVTVNAAWQPPIVKLAAK
jgi:hypothetical protein